MSGPAVAHLVSQKLRQTDWRFSDIMAADQDGNIKPTINKWACLFFAHCSIAEDWAKVAMSEKEKEALYHELVRMNAGNKYRGMGPTCYVANHEDSLNHALQMLGVSARAHYVFIDRVNGEVVYPLSDSKEYKGLVNARVDQWKVQGSNSHFIHVELDGTELYNPYPQLPLLHRMSARGYYIELM